MSPMRDDRQRLLDIQEAIANIEEHAAKGDAFFAGVLYGHRHHIGGVMRIDINNVNPTKARVVGLVGKAGG